MRDGNVTSYPFTWSSRRHDEDFVEEWLDRALLTEEWLGMFPNAIVTNQVLDGSDHFPIIIKLKGKPPNSENSPIARRFLL